MNCPKCGSSNLENSRFCAVCGNTLIKQQTNYVVQEEKDFNENDSIGVSPVSFSFPIIEEKPEIELPRMIGQEDYVEQKELIVEQPIKERTRIKYKLSIKKIILLVICLIIFIAIIGGISFIFNKNNKNQDIMTYFDENKLILIKENNLYGYINSKGKIVVKPQYKDATSFINKYAVVKLPADSSGNEYYGVINNKGKVVLNTTTTYNSSIEYISEENIWFIQGKIYDEDLDLIISKDITVDYLGKGYFTFISEDKVGIMNSQGEITYSLPTNGKYVYFTASISKKEYNELKEDYCRINIDNEKYAIINYKTGKIIYDFTDKYISNKKNNLFELQDHTTYKVIEQIYIEDDKVSYSLTNDLKCEYIGNYILEIMSDGNGYSYYDVKNNKILENKPSTGDVILSNDFELSTGFNTFSCENGYGVKLGEKEIVPCSWDSITYIVDPLYTYAVNKGKQLILTKKNGKINLYDIKARKVIENFNTAYLNENFGESIFISYKDDNSKKIIVYNLINNKKLEFNNNVLISLSSNYFTVKDDAGINYYNSDFKLIYTTS